MLWLLVESDNVVVIRNFIFSRRELKTWPHQCSEDEGERGQRLVRPLHNGDLSYILPDCCNVYNIRTLVLTIITMCGPVYQVIMTSHSSLLTPDSTVNVDQRAAKQNTHPPSGHSIIRDERTGRPENPHFTFHSQKITSIERKHNHSIRHLVKTLCSILMYKLYNI